LRRTCLAIPLTPARTTNSPPPHPYALTPPKTALITGIKLCEALRRQHGIRRFHEATQANAPIVSCWGTGTPLWEFLHVDDLGEIHWEASQPKSPPKKQLDVSRLAALGWRAHILLREGLESTVSRFRDQLRQPLVRF